MFKINKDLNNIPVSLLSSKTHTKRQDHIAAGHYIQKASYNEYYKKEDIKEALEKIHYNKCAYCEVWVEELHVEHYRPKSIYYWLAYSWDNLLLACPTCNKKKLHNFPCINGNHINIPKDINPDDETKTNRRKFNLLSAKLNHQEQPSLVNPELESSQGKLQFGENGTIESSDARYIATIELCQLNRKKLTERRKKIFDDLINKIRAELVTSNSQQEQQKNISKIFSDVKKDSLDREKDFTSLLIYIFENLSEIAKKITPAP